MLWMSGLERRPFMMTTNGRLEIDKAFKRISRDRMIPLLRQSLDAWH
jgi:hypothetical protein